MSDRDPMVRLLHMRDYAAKIGTLIAGKDKADLEQDEVLCLAVTRLIELIGEAASQYPKELQLQYPQIPWAKMRRNTSSRPGLRIVITPSLCDMRHKIPTFRDAFSPPKTAL
jgi:hypothetical protein